MKFEGPNIIFYGQKRRAFVCSLVTSISDRILIFIFRDPALERKNEERLDIGSQNLNLSAKESCGLERLVNSLVRSHYER